MSKGYFSYIRVSTARQGQSGTSLAEQREAIRRYSERWAFPIVREFEEKETAAKRGRPVFTELLRALKRGQAKGVIIHKIDRGARNLRDWAELGDLIDAGFEVLFANENLDMYSRGGRLSADIQAVVAADYIRNLREEVKKGFYGRLKQGLYPMPAPVGYRNQGKGLPKTIDPVQGPLVRQAFELYATGRWSLHALIEKLQALGLRNRRGGNVTINGLSTMLHNPFYMGLINVRVCGELYMGQHQPLVPKLLFDRVQEVLAGKTVKRVEVHEFLFRRLLCCGGCGRKLIGERQKGYVYYRCQTRVCPQKTIREEAVEAILLPVLEQLRFSDAESRALVQELEHKRQDAGNLKEAQFQELQLQLDQTRGRLSKLTDAYLDGTIEEPLYLDKKRGLIVAEQELKQKLTMVKDGPGNPLVKVREFLELSNHAYLSYKMANREEKRELIENITSNLTVAGKRLMPKLNLPFQMVIERQGVTAGRPSRYTARTLSRLLDQLCDYFIHSEMASPLMLKSGAFDANYKLPKAA